MKAGKLNKLRLATKYNDLGLKISFGKQPVSGFNNETIYYATFFNYKGQSKSCTVVFRFKLIQFKQRILSQTGTEGSGENKKILIFPTGLEVYLEDMF